MSRRPWTTGELHSLREMASMNAVKIGAAIGRTPAAVAMIARRHGIEIAPMPGCGWPESFRRRARMLRNSGVPVREIARRMGASHGAVNNWTRAA